MSEITDEMVDAYMDGVFPEWRAMPSASLLTFRDGVRRGLTSVAPLMVAAERETCARQADAWARIWGGEDQCDRNDAACIIASTIRLGGEP